MPAATETFAPPLLAEGAAVEPELLPPLAIAVLSALLRSLAAWLSTPPAPGEPAAPLPGAPEAEAEAVLELAEEPKAAKPTAPPATMLRAVVARTVWLDSVSAREMPIAAVEAPLATAPEVVMAEAV
jgi:hypothetical protein